MSRLAAWVRDSGRSQRSIASELRITPAHLCNLLQRKRKPSIGLAAKIARLTGLEIEDLA